MLGLGAHVLGVNAALRDVLRELLDDRRLGSDRVGGEEPAARGQRALGGPELDRVLGPVPLAVVVGGGLGTAIAYPIAKALAEAGASVCVGTWPPALGIFETLLRRIVDCAERGEDISFDIVSRIDPQDRDVIFGTGPPSPLPDAVQQLIDALVEIGVEA